MSIFKNFMHTAMESFKHYPNKLSLRSAIHSVIRARDGSVEKSFLSLFSALETLILDFRKSHGLEFILELDTWSKLRQLIKETIKKSENLKLTKQERSRIYSKISELNRLSLNDAFNLFCAHYKISLDDLWPVFGNKEYAGLSEIRNRLIHGDPFDYSVFTALIEAKIQLSIILERSLLSILDCKIEDSNVSQEKVQFYNNSFLNHSENCKAIKDYFKN